MAAHEKTHWREYLNFCQFRPRWELHGPIHRDGKDWRGTCPLCADNGSRGHLAVREEDGRLLLHCWSGCPTEGIVSEFGITMADLSTANNNGNGHNANGKHTPSAKRRRVAYPTIQAAGEKIARRLGGRFTQSWAYTDADGNEVFRVLRFDGCAKPNGEKTYRPIHRNGVGYLEGDPLGLLPLLNLPAILAADRETVIFTFEGEKAALAAQSIGLLATTSAHGAGSAKRTDWTPLRGRDVVILADNDKNGHKYAAEVRDMLLALGCRVRIVHLPDLPEHGDIVDWLEQHDGAEPEALRDQIVALAGEAKPEGKRAEESGETSSRIIVVSASRLLEIEPPEPDQILTDTFDRGDKITIVGSSKLRKSFFFLQMMLSIASGRDFLRWAVPKPCRVFAIQFEIQGHHFHRRVKRMARAMDITSSDLSDRLQVVNARGLGIAGVSGIRKIMEAAMPFAPDAVFVDPLYKIATGAENVAEDAKIILNSFDALAETTGAAVAFVHHDPKGFSGDRDIRDRGAGSNVLSRDYDGCVALTPHVSEPDGVVVETLLRNYRPQEPFAITWTEGPSAWGTWPA